MVLALGVLTACSSDPATPTSTTTLGTTPAEESSVAKLVLSWCVTGTSSASARTQATDAGLTAAQADFAIQQYEAMKASSDKC